MIERATIDHCMQSYRRGESESLQIYRLFNSEKLRVERFGDRLISSIYDSSLSAESVHSAIKALPSDIFIYRLMHDRGADPHSRQQIIFDKAGKPINPSTHWLASENDIQFLLKCDQGKSYGLFIDQRENRKRIQNLAKDKRALNLFSYTGGFGLAATKGHCLQVDNVDTSQKTLDWLAENTRINDFDLSICTTKKIDCFQFLKTCLRKETKYDIVVLDPPSFSRGKKQVFKLEKSWDTLLDQIYQILNTRGTLLFSCNLEKWSQSYFIREMKNWGSEKFDRMEFPPPTWDTQQTPQTMKSVIFYGKTHKE